MSADAWGRAMNDAAEVPPHSIEAEQSVLGAMLLDNARGADIRESLSPDDFYSAGHRLIYEHVDSLLREGEPADVMILANALQAAGKLDYVGGMSYLAALVENVPTAANIKHYAGIVRERAECRRLAAVANDIRTAAMNPNGRRAAEIQAEAREVLRPTAPAGLTMPAPIGDSEFMDARLAPDCIVENYLFADVAVLIAPGGTGKTTLLLHEAVHVVLRRSLYGLAIKKPGPVLILTAEDSREMLVARLRAICGALDLTQDEIAVVRRDVRILDVCGSGFKLTRVVGDVVVTAPAVDSLIEEAGAVAPVLVTFDPAISFGIGESRVNDAEQGLVEAARRIRRELNCGVRYVHHSGKQNARDEVVDQYAGRGGSTLPDGARMVAVLQPLTPDKWRTATGSSLLEGENGMLLARPKLSFAPPQPDILLSRRGYAFAFTSRTMRTKDEELGANVAQVLRKLEVELDAGRKHTQNSLQALDLGISRAAVRDAVQTLVARGQVEHAPIDPTPIRGPRAYLRPVAAPNDNRAPR